MNKSKHGANETSNKQYQRVQKQWSVAEKEKLLKALKKHGDRNIDEISKEIGTKGPSAVRLMIHKLKKKATSTSELVHCISMGTFDDVRLPIPQALNFISLFEKHPEKEESGGFDFRAIYHYLSQMTLGHPPPSMPEENYAVWNEFLAEIDQEVLTTSEEQILNFLEKLDVRRSQHFRRCYPSVHGLESRSSIIPDKE